MKKHVYGSILLASILVLAGCGGGSGNGNDNGGRSQPIVEGTRLPELPGLTGDANNNGKLFFATTEDVTIQILPEIEAEMEKISLWAIDPTAPDSPYIVEDDMDPQTTGVFDLLPIHTAKIAMDGKTINSFEIDRVIYASRSVQPSEGSTELAKINRVSTNSAIPINNLQPEQVSSETSGELATAMRRILQFDLTNADQTALAYNTETDGDHLTEWKMIRLGDSAQTSPSAFLPHYEVVTTVRDMNDPAKPGGWLVIDLDDDKTLYQVALDGGTPKPVHDKNGSEINNLKFVDMIGGERLDGSQFLSLTFDDSTPRGEGDPLKGELWYFKRSDDPNENSVAYPLFNADGEKLYFDMGFLSAFGAAVPDGEHVATHGDDTYFFKHEGLILSQTALLYRANEDGWEWLHGEAIDISMFDEDEVPTLEDFLELFGQDVELEKGGPLVTVGDYLVWTTDEELKSWHTPTGELKILDGFDRYHDGNQVPKVSASDYSMGALGSRDGWVFYNRTLTDLSNLNRPVRTEYAVAVQIGNPSSEINIANARWIGASTSGTNSGDSNISRMELSEVFLLTENGDLGAVSAANPPNGMVKLGRLDNVDQAALASLAPGPHRLIRIKHDNNEEEVVYVNTGEENSLVRLTKNSDRNFKQAWPVRGF